MSALTDTLAAIAGDVLAVADQLNRLDSVAGDGDLGVTMSAGANALRAALPEVADQDTAAVLTRCGAELARKAPSTAGTLLATGFLRAGRAARDVVEGERDVAQVARLLAAAQQGIEERGKAAVGDRTLLDALAPAVAALRAADAEGLALPVALARAATAAGEGAVATKDLRARVGRAGWLADRALGHEDAGARLVAILLDSAARHVA
jgi:dihydroxyacetone kinase-like protein